MEKLFAGIPKPILTLYGVGIASPVFLDLNEYKNFPEDGICGRVGERCYLNYDVIDIVEYLGDFDGKSDVFKKTSKTKEVTFYCLDFQEGIQKVLEGKIVDGKVSWNFSSIEDLWYTYKGFRERGIVFTYDFYKLIDEKNSARERQALLNMELLKERQALLDKSQYLLNAYIIGNQESKPQDESSTPTIKGVVGVIKKLINK